MWKHSTGKGITIALIDTGVRKTASLKGRVLRGKDWTRKQGNEFKDTDGHGTSMAELIAGKANGVKGLAPASKIIPHKISLKSSKKELGKGSEADRAIRAAANSPAKIINISLGGYHTPQLAESVKYARSKGKLLFAATGNDGAGKNSYEFPAGYPEVVGVASTDANGKRSKTSSYGDSVDLGAPGKDAPYWCDETFTRYCNGDGGTSAATALASASAALLWSKHPNWTANQVLRVLINTAGKPKWGKVPSIYGGYGVVRPRMNLLDNEGDPGPADTSPWPGKAKARGKYGTPELANPNPDDSKATDNKDNNHPDDKGTDTDPHDQNQATHPDNSHKSSDNALYLTLGATVAVVLGGAGVYALLRRRRNP
ncbi:S8 family serine peptidase [Streptomyces sp. NPDC005438]|uniref:S8 family serine peptidase n=1 Tax=Streptomyces sp. NPDC005438 TaxID=3156880 RepID=UPI0033A89588